MTGSIQRSPRLWRILSGLLVLATGGIHLFLIFEGVGSLLAVLFALNAVAGILLGVAMIVARGRLLAVTTVLSLLFMVASLLALVLALTVGLFGIRETWSFTLVPESVIIEAVGVVVLAITTGLVVRRRSRRDLRP